MKKFLLVVSFVAVTVAAWFYNSGVTAIASLPVVLLIQSILVAGNMSKAWADVSPDTVEAKAGTSVKVSIWSYIISTSILPFLWVAVFSIIGFFPLSTIMVFLTLPVAIGCSRAMRKFPEGAVSLLGDLSDRTLNLSLMFSALLALAFIVGKFI